MPLQRFQRIVGVVLAADGQQDAAPPDVGERSLHLAKRRTRIVGAEPEAIDAVTATMVQLGNPSSLHGSGRRSRRREIESDRGDLTE